MPKRFLPNLRKPKKQQQEKQNQIKKSEKSKSDIDSIIVSDSLGYEYANPYNPLIKVFKAGIILVSSIFCILLLVNSYYNMQLRHLVGEQAKLINRLSEVKEVENEILEVSSRIDYYKNILVDRDVLEPKTSYLMQSLSVNNVALKRLHIEDQEFEIDVAVEKPAVFAKMINDILREKVAYIVIQSANFNTSDQNYLVNIKGVFKND